MGDILQLLQSKSAPVPATKPTPTTPRPTSPTVINHSTHPITTNRLSYHDSAKVVTPPSPIMTPVSVPPTINRGLRPNGSTEPPATLDTDLKSPTGQRQCRCQDYISGHYWNSYQYADIHDGKGYARFQVAWLHHNIDGLHEGKPDKLQKLTLSLADDSTKAFLRFYYAALRSGLGACGYHEELLPTLSTARVGFDVRDTPLVNEDLVTVGRTMGMDEPPRDHWQSQHDTLGMNLYPLLDYAIKATATRARHLVDNSITLGNPNGLTILHDLLRYHHPRVLDSLAPPFETNYHNSPKMQKPGKDSTYDLMVDDFKARCNEWELSISMYPEV
jgi:hypothetical protein